MDVWLGSSLIDDRKVKTPEDVFEYNHSRQQTVSENTLLPSVLTLVMREIIAKNKEDQPEREEEGLGIHYTECYIWLKWWDKNKERYVFRTKNPPSISSRERIFYGTHLSTMADNGLLNIHAVSATYRHIIERAAAEMGIDVHIGRCGSHYDFSYITTIHMKSVTFDEFLGIIGRHFSTPFKYVKNGSRYIIGDAESPAPPRLYI